MKKRVLLINPPDTRPFNMRSDRVRIGLVAPIGLAYIAAVLEQDGVEVQILDCLDGQMQGVKMGWGIRYGLTDDEIYQRIGSFSPDIVGVSCLFSNKSYDAHNICKIAKSVRINIMTIMGGVHPTALQEETLSDFFVDQVCPGEGELWMLEAVRRFPLKGEHRHPLVNLDQLPMPARHLLNMPLYMNTKSTHSGVKRWPVGSLSSSRGCPGRCSFCAIRGLWGEAFRMRSADNVLNEIDHLIKTYGIRELHFEDDCLTANKRRAMAIFQGIIDRGYDLTISSPSGLAVFAMDEELMGKMKEAGYYSLSFAIESGNQHVLKDLIHKNVDLVKAKRLVDYARTIGLKTKAFFILGYPGESKDTMRETVDFAYSLGADWSLFFPATPLPGTDMFNLCVKNQWIDNPNLDDRYAFFTPNIRTNEFTPEDVTRIRDAANERVNFTENINLRLGNYERAYEDFQEIVNLYPELKIAREALAKCPLSQ